MFYVKLNLDGLKPLFSSLTKKELRKALIRAIKLSARKAKVRAVDLASKEYALKKGDLRKRIFIKPQFGGGDDPKAKVIFQYRSIPLHHFDPKQTAGGVSLKIMRNGPRIVLKHAFMAQGKGRGGKRVFLRKEAAGGGIGAFITKLPAGGMRRSSKGSALPIVGLVEKHGLSEVMQPYAEELRTYAGEVGQEELKRQIDLLLGR